MYTWVSKRTRIIVQLGLSGLLTLWNTLPAAAGGYTQLQGDTFTSVTFRTLDSGSFRKLELQLYLEYGLENDITLIFKSPYNWLEQGDSFNQGFADQEVGVRWRFNQDPNLATSLQAILIVPPGYDPNENPALGRGIVGAEIRLPVTGTFRFGRRNGYWTVEAAYRDYLGPQSDEIRVFAEVSQELAEQVAIAIQLDHISDLGNSQRFREVETDLTKLIGQLRVRLNNRTALVFGGYTNITGAEGSGLEFQVWYTFGPRR